jgi:hypothetical protein
MREEVLHHAAPREPGAQATAEQPEKRRHTRFPVSVSAEVIEAKTRARVTGRATDLGVGGCYIDTLSTFSEGTQVEVLLRSQGRTFHCHALVTYAVTQSAVGMGLAFTEAAADEEFTLLDWISSLGVDAPAAPQHKAGPEITSGVDTGLEKQRSLKEIIQKLVTLLARKKVLTDSEAVRILSNLE